MHGEFWAKVKSNTLFILNWLLWLLLPKIGLLFNLTSGHSAPRRQSTIFTFSGGRLFQVFSSQRLHHLFLSHDLNLSLSLSLSLRSFQLRCQLYLMFGHQLGMNSRQKWGIFLLIFVIVVKGFETLNIHLGQNRLNPRSLVYALHNLQNSVTQSDYFCVILKLNFCSWKI